VTNRPELVALRSFLSVYRTGGVARAAEALRLSQPAVSHHLKAIEESVGRPLFRRSGRGIAPTEAGHSLAAEVAEHIDALEGALDGLRSATLSGAGPVFVGAPVDLLERFVVTRMAPLLAEGLTVRCRVGLSPDLTQAVLGDEIDVALLTKIEGVPTRRMYLVQLLEERFLLVGRSGDEPYEPGQERRFVGYSEEMPMARRYFRECWANSAAGAGTDRQRLSGRCRGRAGRGRADHRAALPGRGAPGRRPTFRAAPAFPARRQHRPHRNAARAGAPAANPRRVRRAILFGLIRYTD